jgi:hypothetical protein
MGEEPGRCYTAGVAVGQVQCQIDAAIESTIESKNESALKFALYKVSKFGKDAATMIPDGKDIANIIAHRSRMLLKIATDLHGKAPKEARFFQDQLYPLRGYAYELENRAMISCVGYQHPSHELEPLPPIPKGVKKEAEKEKKKYHEDILKRHQKWLKKKKIK